MVKRQRTYLAQVPEAAGRLRGGVPVACLPVTLAEVCTVQRGLKMAGSAFFTVLGTLVVGLPNGLHIMRNPRGHRTASRRAGQRAPGL